MTAESKHIGSVMIDRSLIESLLVPGSTLLEVRPTGRRGVWQLIVEHPDLARVAEGAMIPDYFIRATRIESQYLEETS